MKTKVQGKNFGKIRVEIDFTGHITISNGWFTNHGCIYPHMIESCKQELINPITDSHYQVIGMDAEISKTQADYIYNKIKKGYFDHLIEKRQKTNKA